MDRRRQRRERRELKHRAKDETRTVPMHPELVILIRDHIKEIGKALVETLLVERMETERSLGTAHIFYSDLYVIKAGEPVRIELMWRAKAGRADIANYTLMKLGNYGRAIGLLE